ncbi:MAG: CHAP domain-containing protein [Polyangiaceae bacterium]
MLRGRSAYHSARKELAAGIEKHGRGKTWETEGSNRGPMVDEYVSAFTDLAGRLPWCGMFVGFQYLKAGFKTSGTLPASQTTDGAGASRKTVFMSATRLMLYLKGAGKPHVEMPSRGSAPTTREACAAWLDKNLTSFAPRAGDIVLFRSGGKDYGHVGMVASYDAATHKLITYEGNLGNRASAWSWDLADPSDIGFYRVNLMGRLGEDDFEARCEIAPEGPSPEPTIETGGASTTT